MSDHRPRLCIVPRWAGNQSMEWYDWLCATDVVRESFSEVIRPDLENWQEPTIASWVTTLQTACGTSGEELARTFLVGHSVGCQAIIRYLASLPEGTTVSACLLVAGWWTLDEPWDSILPWIYPLDSEDREPANPFNLARVRAACHHIVTLISDNDPYTADWRQTQQDWHHRVNAQIRVIPGAEHFNGEDQPAVRATLAAMLSGPA